MITTEKLLQIIERNDSLDSILEKVPDITFINYVEALLEKYNMSKSEMFHKAQIQRTYGYQILDGRKRPSKTKVIQIALALQADEHETNNLLSLSNNGHLYPKVKFDAVILVALKKHYSVIETNFLLEEYQLPIL